VKARRGESGGYRRHRGSRGEEKPLKEIGENRK
jgi:hypothetical protein